MAGLWILTAVACVATLLRAQHLHRETTYVSEDEFSETLQDQSDENQNDRSEGPAMGRSKPLQHSSALLGSAPSAELLKSGIERKLNKAKSMPATRSWALGAASKAAAHMLSHHLSQCLAVVSYTGEEKELQPLITSLNAFDVPRLLLLRRRGFMGANKTGETPPFI